MKKFTIVEASDWFGLYVNGDLVHQNHQMESTELLDAVGVPYDYKYIEEQDMHNFRFLPNTLEDLDFMLEALERDED